MHFYNRPKKFKFGINRLMRYLVLPVRNLHCILSKKSNTIISNKGNSVTDSDSLKAWFINRIGRLNILHNDAEIFVFTVKKTFYNFDSENCVPFM